MFFQKENYILALGIIYFKHLKYTCISNRALIGFNANLKPNTKKLELRLRVG